MAELAAIEPTPISEPLDKFLVEVVRTLQTAADKGIKSVQDDPAVAERSVADCEEMLEIIMAGNVQEWIA
jgi:hypothetical protein